ncbi:MAG: hypothetical protein J0I32_13625 [Sphingobacteriales bacterium]|nr:hypothetical protein [Sphingobacteriales bacterium]OJW03035.1 MAG: hypothetical protein BGO52_01660 [Sphingobacteriales bacterium 44-61]
MTEPITEQATIPAAPAPGNSTPRIKTPSTIAFAIGVLLFFMPFIDIRCNDMSLQKVNGAELATGFKIKGPDSGNSFLDGFGNGERKTKTGFSSNDKKDPNVYALAALALGALGLLLSFSNARLGGIGGVLTGSLAAASLIGLLIDIKRQIKADLSLKNGDAGIKIAVDFTPWFYLAVVSFIVAAYFSYKRMKT